MKSLVCLTLATLGLARLASAAEVAPHPTLEGRLVETREHFSVEYSPDLAPLTDSAFAQLEAIDQRFDAASEDLKRQFTPDTDSPQPTIAIEFSATYMRLRRDTILAETARQIGLDAPTDLQKQTYDTFLDYYEESEHLAHETAAAVLQMRPNCLQLWKKADLAQRLRDGTAIDSFDYTPETGKIQIKFRFSTPMVSPGRQEEIKAAMLSRTLDHTFGRTGNFYHASVTIGGPEKPDPKPKTAAVPLAAESSTPNDLAFPCLAADDGSLTDAFALTDQIAQQFINIAYQKRAYHDPAFALIVLHETVEVGLMEVYTRSPDRRWFFDGAANVVSCKVVESLASPAYSNSFYNLDAELQSFRHLQNQIDLRAWSSAENQNLDTEQLAEINRAHYPFATRAVFQMAAQLENKSLASLFRLLPHHTERDSTYKDLARAYKKLTGQRLAKLIKTAETTPIP